MGKKNNLRHIILYDGDCGLCNKFKNKFDSLDQKKIFDFIPFQDVSQKILEKYRIDRKQCEKKIQMLRIKGSVWSGIHCVNGLLIHFFPYSILPILMYIFPPFLLLEMLIYALVAKNRHQISGSACRKNEN